MNNVVNQGNFAAHFRGFMDSMGIRTRPARVDTSVTPPRIVHDNEPVETMRTLVSVPHIGDPSSVRNALLASGDGDLSVALRQVQGVVDGVMSDIKHLKNGGVDGLLVGRANRLSDEVVKGHVGAGREWQEYFKAALYRSACDAGIKRNLAIVEFKDAADSSDSKYLRALILELGAASLHKLSNDGQKFLLLFRISEDRNQNAAYDLATGAWNDLLSDADLNVTERTAVIAQGVESSLVGDGRYRAAEPFRRASIEMHSQNPLSAMHDRMRIAWAMAAEASVGDGSGWALVARYMGEMLGSIQEGDIISSADLETLTGFQQLAGDYAVGAFFQGSGRLKAEGGDREAWIRSL